MKIIAEYGEITVKDRYLMTAKSVVKSGFKDVIGDTIKIRCACVCTDEIVSKNDDGTESVREKTIFSIITKEGRVLAGDSKTTIDSFNDLFSAFENEIFSDEFEVTVTGQQSKAGRTFITLQIA